MTNKEAIHCMKSYLPEDTYEACINCKYYGEECKSSEAHNMAIKALEEQSEIIYCKNCKYCETNISPDGNEIYCICKYWDGGTDADGFCHNAERWTNE